MPTARHLSLLTRVARIGLACALLAAACATAAASATASPATYGGISSDGKVAVFSTKDQLVPGDTDQEEDVYARAFDGALGEYVTREISIGPSGGNDTLPAHYDGISSDGTEVFFSTREPMVAADGDHSEDIYVRDLTENRTILVSQGDETCSAQGAGTEKPTPNFVPGGVVPDGGGSSSSRPNASPAPTRTAPSTSTPATSERRRPRSSPPATRPAAPGAAATEARRALFRGTDEAGDRAFFTTSESLTAADTDTESDIYRARPAARKRPRWSPVRAPVPRTFRPVRIANRPSAGPPRTDPTSSSRPTNGSTNEDTDNSQDVYDWSGSGLAALVSIGPDGGNGESIVTYAGTSGDGGTVYFQTSERLDATADTDQSQDVYQRSGGTTTLVSTGAGGKGNEAIPASFEWASPAAGTPVVVFSTRRVPDQRRHRLRARTSTSARAASPPSSRPDPKAPAANSAPASPGPRPTARRSSSSPPNRWSPKTPIRAPTSTCAPRPGRCWSRPARSAATGLPGRPARRLRRRLARLFRHPGAPHGRRRLRRRGRRLRLERGRHPARLGRQLARPGLGPAASGARRDEPGVPQRLDHPRDRRPGRRGDLDQGLLDRRLLRGTGGPGTRRRTGLAGADRDGAGRDRLDHQLPRHRGGRRDRLAPARARSPTGRKTPPPPPPPPAATATSAADGRRQRR